MKHTDLQIGDYVYHKDKIVKVDMLSPSDFNLAVADKDGTGGALYKDIEPIEITPEILKKNGFHYLEDRHFYYNLEVDLHPMMYGHYAPYRIGKMPVFIEYVHELQHVLRLCKIDKEIEL